jgi:methionyl-tRNA synthetase
MITCERCNRESSGNRCDHCGHRTVIQQDINEVRIYLDRAMKIKKEKFPDLIKEKIQKRPKRPREDTSHTHSEDTLDDVAKS